MEADNPFAIGMSGLIGWGDASRAMHEAELLVLWGTDFPYRSYLPTHGHVVQVDRRAEALGRRVPICLGIHADVASTARMLLPLVQRDRGDEFLSRSLSRHGKELSRLQTHIRHVDEHAPLPPHEFQNPVLRMLQRNVEIFEDLRIVRYLPDQFLRHPLRITV